MEAKIQYFPMEDLTRIKELWTEKLKSIDIDPEEVDMDYLATNFYPDLAVVLNSDGKTIESFTFEQPDDEIKSLIRRRYLKTSTFKDDYRKKTTKFRYAVNRRDIIAEFAAKGIVISEDPADYIDHGDYIELKKPIGRVKMIEKYGSVEPIEWEKARNYAKRLRRGGLNDWRLPKISELKAVYAIKDICGIKKCRSSFYDMCWSASAVNGEAHSCWALANSTGVAQLRWIYRECYVRCIRYENKQEPEKTEN
ncbi:DUF1566 domain-containing protein [bacterium]|nr:DUF1566 domain-containing protein [bacterium]